MSGKKNDKRMVLARLFELEGFDLRNETLNPQVLNCLSHSRLHNISHLHSFHKSMGYSPIVLRYAQDVFAREQLPIVFFGHAK